MTEVLMTKEDSVMQIIFNGKYFLIDFPYDAKIYATMHQITGAEKGTIVEHRWTVPKSSFTQLSAELQPYIIWKSTEELYAEKEELKHLSQAEESLEDVFSRMPKVIETPYMKIEPYDFQKLSVAWAMTPKGKRGQIQGGLLADLMGLGKTIQALAISGKFKEMYGIKRCLIICPATLKFQWSKEIEKFTSESSVIINGDDKKRTKQFEKIRNENPFYTIVNYELLITRERLGKELIPAKNNYQKPKNKIIFGEYTVLNELLSNQYDMVIIDEAHNIKNPDAERSKAIRKIQPPFKLLMTGTPITKDLQNIFQLLDYLSPNILSSDKFTFEQRRKHFEDRFLIMVDNPFMKWNKEKVPAGVRNIGLLKNLLSPYMLRRTTEEVSDELPTQVEVPVIVEWEKDQKSLYEQLSKELLALQEAREKATEPEEAQRLQNEMHSLYTYLLEVCDTPELLAMSDSRTARSKLPKDKKYARPPKLTRLVEMSEELMLNNEEKIIIFTKFERMTQIIQRELTQLSKELSKKDKSNAFNMVMYTGKNPEGCKRKDQLEKQGLPSKNLNCLECPLIAQCNTREKSAWLFQNDPNTRVIIATDAANAGVNLQKGKYLFNYDLPDSFAKYDQRKGRNKRLGSEHEEVYVFNFGIEGAIDAAKFNKLMNQKDVIDLVVEKNHLEEEAVKTATEEINMMHELLKELQKK